MTRESAERRRALLPNNIISKTFVKETVLMDVNRGRYVKLDASAGAMLDALLAEPSVAAAAAALSARGWGAEETVLGDLDALCSELTAHGLVRLQAA